MQNLWKLAEILFESSDQSTKTNICPMFWCWLISVNLFFIHIHHRQDSKMVWGWKMKNYYHDHTSQSVLWNSLLIYLFVFSFFFVGFSFVWLGLAIQPSHFILLTNRHSFAHSHPSNRHSIKHHTLTYKFIRVHWRRKHSKMTQKEARTINLYIHFTNP